MKYYFKSVSRPSVAVIFSFLSDFVDLTTKNFKEAKILRINVRIIWKSFNVAS